MSAIFCAKPSTSTYLPDPRVQRCHLFVGGGCVELGGGADLLRRDSLFGIRVVFDEQDNALDEFYEVFGSRIRIDFVVVPADVLHGQSRLLRPGSGVGVDELIPVGRLGDSVSKVGAEVSLELFGIPGFVRTLFRGLF